MQYIQSRHNQHVKHITHLARSRSYRHNYGECIVEGARALGSFITSRHTVTTVYMTKDAFRTTQVPIGEDRICIVPDHVMDKMSVMQTPSGIIGHITLSSWQTDVVEPGLCLYRISDPGNVGNLIRTSVALGYTSVQFVECADPWNPKAVQASVGTIGHAYIHETTWETIHISDHVTTYALTARNASTIDQVPLHTPLIIVGNEAHGLPEHITQQADYRTHLHMPGCAESYNAAVAGSIALYMVTYRGYSTKG